MMKHSLRLRLIVGLSIAAFFIWCVSTAVAWVQVRKEVSEMFDAQQVLFAERLASSDLKTMLGRGGFYPDRPPRPRSLKSRNIEDDSLAFAIFSANGKILMDDGDNGRGIQFAPVRGFSHAALSHDSDMWRIFWLPVAGGRLFIAVGQELEYREEIINGIVFGQMGIWLAGLPILLALIIIVVNKELRSIRQVSQQILKRTPDDTTLLSQNVPSEILPLVTSLNGFFDRTLTTLQRERRFTSDAAHELRSPLAALRIQTEIAQLADDDPALRAQALSNLTQGIDRAGQLIEQLLTLSRLDSLQQLESLENIEWDQLIPSLLGELYFTAQKRDIELQYQREDPLPIMQGQPILLSLMLRNLIDNAIKYCPCGSQVTVLQQKNRIQIVDNGGGVNEEDLQRLGQRFYRPAGQNEKGSGLGLSIVKRIAELHHYQIQIRNRYNASNERIGLAVSIYFNPTPESD